MNVVTIYTPQGGSATLWVEKIPFHTDRVCSATPLSPATLKWIESEGFIDVLVGKIQEDIVSESKFIEEALKS